MAEYGSGNPYVHDGPITDPEYFTGRTEEIERIEYNLQQSVNDPKQFRNIGITGKEGAGKSSLTHMVRHYADQLNILPVRITLDESDVKNEVRLFQQILDAITESVGGSLRESFINWLAGLTDQVEFDLKFARVYLSPQSDNDHQEVLDSILREDLSRIYEESDFPSIAIILDNAQYLAENTVVLQKFKNVFTEIDGYNLILSGTEDTFSDIHSAFSPIARTFDRIEIGPFDQYSATRDCVLGPLTEEEEKLVGEDTIAEIHKITGGRAYEINLISHHMYACYEQGIIDDISLSSEVIDRVMEQMDVWRRSVDSDLPRKITNLSSDQIKLLISSIECGSLSRESLRRYSLLDSLGNLEEIEIQNKLDEIDILIDSLLEEEILLDNNGELEFGGDMYSTAFLMYHSLSREHIDNIGPTTKNEGMIPNIYYKIMNSVVLNDLEEYDFHTHFVPKPETGSEMRLKSINDLGGALHQRLEELPEEADKVLESITIGDKFTSNDIGEDFWKVQRFDVGNYSSYPSYSFRCEIKWTDSAFNAIVHIEDEDEYEIIKTKIEDNLKSVQEMLGEIGCEIILKDGRYFLDQGTKEVRDGNLDKAIEYLSEAIEFNPYNPRYRIKRGNVYADMEMFDKSVEDLEFVTGIYEDYTAAHLSLGRVYLDMGEYEEGVHKLQKATSILPEQSEVWERCSCALAEFADESWEKIEEFADEALRLDPDNHHARIHAAQSKYRLGNTNTALNYLDEVIEKSSDYVIHAKITKGVLLVEPENFREGISILESIEGINSDQKAAIEYNLSCAYSLAGDFETSIRHLEESISLDDEYVELAKEDDDLEFIREKEKFTEILSSHMNDLGEDIDHTAS